MKNDFVKGYYSNIVKGTSVNLLGLPNEAPQKQENMSPTTDTNVSVMDRLTDIFGSTTSTINSSEVEEVPNPVVDFTHVLVTENKMPPKPEEFRPCFEKIEFESKFNHCMTTLTAPPVNTSPNMINNFDFLMNNSMPVPAPSNNAYTNAANTLFDDCSKSYSNMTVTQEPTMKTVSKNDEVSEGLYPSFNDIDLNKMIKNTSNMVVNKPEVTTVNQTQSQNVFDFFS